MSKAFDPETLAQLQAETLAIRAGSQRSQFGEHSEALFLTSSYLFDSAAQAAARFSGQEPGPVYSRFSNPTVAMFEERLAALEGGEAALATASGMAATTMLCMGLLQQGDHVIASQSLFGATVQLFSQVLPRFGIAVSLVDGGDLQAWQAAIQTNTKLMYLETPSNPLTEITDIAALSQLAHSKGVLVAVDNCFCTPILQKPLALGADIVIHSATKYLDGQGRVLGGAIVGPKTLLQEKIYPMIRTIGPTLSAFNAWVLLKGLETLPLRMMAQSERALTIAQRLEAHPAVSRVYYPGLPSHPQHELAKRQQTTGAAILAFEVGSKTDPTELQRQRAWRVIDNTQLISITANLGDTRSTITHPATTTHGRLSPEQRTQAGIRENLVRLAVGLEHIDDLWKDLSRGLDG